MANAEPGLTRRFQERGARLRGNDQQQGRILRTLAFRRAALVSVVEHHHVLPSLHGGALFDVHGTDAAQRRRGQPSDLGAAFEVNEDDLVPGRVVRERDATPKRHEIAGSSWSVKSYELCPAPEVVKRERVAPRDGGDLSDLPGRMEARQCQRQAGNGWNAHSWSLLNDHVGRSAKRLLWRGRDAQGARRAPRSG